MNATDQKPEFFSSGNDEKPSEQKVEEQRGRGRDSKSGVSRLQPVSHLFVNRFHCNMLSLLHII